MRVVKIFIVLALTVGLCPIFGAVGSGGIYAVDFYHTLAGMRAAAQGQPGTGVWSNGQLLVYMFQHGAGYGFAVVNQNGQPVDDLLRMVNGNGMSVRTAAEFIRGIEANGYTRLTPDQIPLTWTQMLLSYFAAAVSAGSRSLITPILLPIAPPIDLNPEVQS